MTALAYAQATARARRDVVTAKEVRLMSDVNRRLRRLFEAMGVTDWKRLTEGSWD